MYDEIRKWQSRFRILKDWEIIFDKEWDSLRSQVHVNENKATIGGGLKNLPSEYILHEMLHIALKAAQRSREADELLVQDLTEIIIRPRSSIG